MVVVVEIKTHSSSSKRDTVKGSSLVGSGRSIDSKYCISRYKYQVVICM